MARGRFLSKAISLDEKVDALSDDTARLLFTWLIPHLDCEGRMYADPQIFKAIVAPRRNYYLPKIKKYLTEMENLGLIFQYSVGGNTFLWVPHFEKHQVGLRKNQEAQSQIPPPTTELQRDKNEVETVLPPHKISISKDKISSSLTDCQQQILQELWKLPKWKQDNEDIVWVKEFKEEFPAFWISHIKACRDYWDGKKNPRSKGDWKNRLRNWMKNDRRGNGKIPTDSSREAWNK
jgi:hypothetical protein